MSSPIETMLVNALLEHDIWDLGYYRFSEVQGRVTLRPTESVYGLTIEVDGEEWYGDCSPGPTFFLARQAAFLNYKIDILLISQGDILAVECDGFDWHDRTKQQASADRARDRELFTAGLPTIRFTGSDIHRDVSMCARECMEAVQSMSERRDRIWKIGVKNGLRAVTDMQRRQQDNAPVAVTEEGAT